MTDSQAAILLEKVQRLERERGLVRWLRALVVVVPFALVLNTVWTWQRSRVVEAERIVLKDQSGRVRAVLSAGADGSSQLALKDAKGRDQLILQASDSSSGIHVLDRGQQRASLSSSGGWASLNLLAGDGVGASGMYVLRDGTTGLAMRHGLQGVQFAAQPDGLAGLSVTDSAGDERGRIGALPEGTRIVAPAHWDGEAPFRKPPDVATIIGGGGAAPVPSRRLTP